MLKNYFLIFSCIFFFVNNAEARRSDGGKACRDLSSLGEENGSTINEVNKNYEIIGFTHEGRAPLFIGPNETCFDYGNKIQPGDSVEVYKKYNGFVFIRIKNKINGNFISGWVPEKFIRDASFCSNLNYEGDKDGKIINNTGEIIGITQDGRAPLFIGPNESCLDYKNSIYIGNVVETNKVYNGFVLVKFTNRINGSINYGWVQEKNIRNISLKNDEQIR